MKDSATRRYLFLGVLFILACLSGMSGNAYAANVNIPDPNFKAFLVANYDPSGDGEIQETEAQKVTDTMDTPGHWSAPGNITDLTGIEAFTNLTGLTCSSEQLMSLNVSVNTSLANLSCGHNQLTSLDVSANIGLFTLNCYDNQLSSLDISANTVLANLSCGQNQLNSLDVSANTNLIDLDCGYNALENLNVSANIGLTGLTCYDNQLSSFDISANTALTFLSCGQNQLTNLDVSANTSLINLYCHHNQLTDIPDVTSCLSMERYNCSYNYFDADACPTIAAIKAMGLTNFTYNPQRDGSILICTVDNVDFNGDSIHDVSLFNPSNYKWYIKDQSTPTYGTSNCLPVPADYDGDGVTDLAVVDLTRLDGRAKWYLDGIGVFIYGLQDWIPVPGDYDGDGVIDASLFDPTTGKWYIKDQFVTVYGAGAIPVPGDYNGDGITDIAVFYPDTNKWYIKDVGTYTYGMADCIPVAADYDGDGATDLAVIDTSRPDGRAKWYIRDQSVFIYGSVTDTIPVPGDYDGDGDADPCLFYQNLGKWYCRNVGVCAYGNGDMIPLAVNLATRYAISQAKGGSAVW